MCTGSRTVRPELARPRPIAQHALLDQVAERQTLTLVLARDRDHEPQVRVDHAVLGLEVAALDALGQLDLLLGGEQRVLARLVEEELERILQFGRVGVGFGPGGACARGAHSV
jgi:hypothetical protein